MENKEVYFEIILPKSSYLNYRLGITKVVTPNETAIDAWDVACAEAEEWHKKKHPELYTHNTVQLSVEDTDVVNEINSAPTVDVLARLKGRLNQATKPYYMDKLKELTNGK